MYINSKMHLYGFELEILERVDPVADDQGKGSHVDGWPTKITNEVTASLFALFNLIMAKRQQT